MVEVLSDTFERQLVVEINKVRAGAYLPTVAIFPGYRASAEEQAKLMAEDKAEVKNAGFKQRADNVLKSGRGGFQEIWGQKLCDADVQKGSAELIQVLLSSQKAKLDDRGLREIGIAVAKKDRMYSYLFAFISQTAAVPKGKKEDTVISTPAQDQEILALMNKVREEKGLSKLALLEGYHALADEPVKEMASGQRPLSTDGFDGRFDKVQGKLYKEGVGFLMGEGNALDRASQKILEQQGENIENPAMTHAGVVVGTCGTVTVWLLGFAKMA